MKICYLVFVLLFIFISNVVAGSMSINEKEVEVEQKVSSFSQKADWFNLDSYIDYVGTTEFVYETSLPEEKTVVTPSYFSTLDYASDNKIDLIFPENIKNIISIKSENNVNLKVKYCSLYNIPILSNYPKLYYKKKDSSESWTERIFNSVGNDSYSIDLNLDYGIYEYYVCADNENYPDVYNSSIAQFIVTERPNNFKNLNQNLQDDKGNSTANVEFKWSAEPGVSGDVLKYKLFLGTDVNSMQEYNLSSQNFYVADTLLPRTRYYWKVEAENQYGVGLLNPVIFNFVTLGQVAKLYNAPNPFNPQKGQKTRLFFEMYQDGSAEINIYSEYGDKIRTMYFDNLPKGTNEIEYDGKDDYGNTLYNGTYLCVLKKKCSGSSKTEKCRLLIIK